MRISLSTLRCMPSGERACDEAHEWFHNTFAINNDTVELREAWDTLKSSHVPEKYDWLVWFGCNYVPLTTHNDFIYFVAGLTCDYHGSEKYARSVTQDSFDHANDWLLNRIDDKSRLCGWATGIDNVGYRSDHYPRVTPHYGEEMVNWLEKRIFTELSE